MSSAPSAEMLRRPCAEVSGGAFELEQVDLVAFRLEGGDATLHAAEGAFVEGTVELPAGVVHDAEHEVLGGGGAKGESEGESQELAHA